MDQAYHENNRRFLTTNRSDVDLHELFVTRRTERPKETWRRKAGKTQVNKGLT